MEHCGAELRWLRENRSPAWQFAEEVSEDGLLLLPHLRRPRHSRTVSNMNHKKELPRGLWVNPINLGQPLQGLGYDISNFRADGDSDLRASPPPTP